MANKVRVDQTRKIEDYETETELSYSGQSNVLVNYSERRNKFFKFKAFDAPLPDPKLLLIVSLRVLK